MVRVLPRALLLAAVAAAGRRHLRPQVAQVVERGRCAEQHVGPVAAVAAVGAWTGEGGNKALG